MNRLILFAALSFSLSACHVSGSLKNGYFTGKHTRYHVGSPGLGFENISFRGADIAWIHKETGTTMLLNASCENKEDLPLEALRGQLLIGMTAQEILSQSRIPIEGREALESTVSAKVDGVPQKLKIFLLKKDLCVYELIFSSPPESFDELGKAYDAVLNEFHIVGKTS